MATHSSILACRIPWTEELGGLSSLGHKEWDKTEHVHTHSHKLVSLFLSGKSNGQRSLEDYSPEGLKELNTTEAT